MGKLFVSNEISLTYYQLLNKNCAQIRQIIKQNIAQGQFQLNDQLFPALSTKEKKIENQLNQMCSGGNLSQTDNYPFTVFIEGNVGSGKTSFLSFFKQFDELLVLEEPIEKWRDLKGVNLLDLKFKEPEKFQFPFQHYATLTRLQQHLQVSEKQIKIIERSLFTGRDIHN